MSKIGESILRGLNEALNHAEGKIKLKTHRVKVAEVKTFSPQEILQLRNQLGFTQVVFAAVMGVSVKTVEAWESGRNIPAGSSSRLLDLLSKEPAMLKELVLFDYKVHSLPKQ